MVLVHDFHVKMLFVFVVWCLSFILVRCDNFPSLLQANATVAVVIDKEYMAEEYEPIRQVIETYLVYAKREILKHGGVNVQYFSWTNINIKRDLTAILSIASCSDTWRLFRAAKEENLLQIAISESDCPRLPQSEAITVPILKTGEEMPQLILDTRTSRAYKWKSAIVFYDHTLSRDMVTRVVTSLTKISDAIPSDASAISLMKIETNTSSSINREIIKNVLGSISVSDVGMNFLAILSYENVETMMEIAKQLELVTTKNQWLYVISTTNSNKSDISGVKRLLKEGDNVSFLYNETSGENCRTGLQCHVEEMLQAFSKALDLAILDEVEISNLVSDEEWEAIRPTKLERRNFLLKNINTYIVQNGVCANCSSWKFLAGDTWGREYQKISDENIGQLIQVGKWRPSDGTSLVDELFPHINHGFRGRTLPLISFHNPPWQILKLNQTGHAVEFSGLVFDVVKELARNLNFTYTVLVTQVGTGASGIYSTNRTNFSETIDLVTNFIPEDIIQMVRSKKVAIGACAFTIMDKGKEIVNYTIPISTQPYTFIVARPKELSRALLFMSPFRLNAWLCIAAALLLMGPILYYIHISSPVYGYKGIDIRGGLSSVENCIWYMYGALLQQGGMHLPYADSARLIVGAWWLVVLVISTTYCGNLVAFLTFPKIDIPITTIDDMLAHRETVSWSISRDSFLEDQLKTSKEPKYRAVYTGMDTKRTDTSEILPRIVQGKHVYIDWKLRLQYLMRKQFVNTDRCDLALGKEEFMDEQIAMIMAQDTPYLQTINQEIKRLHQVGLIQKWLSNYLPKKDRCFKVKHTEVNNHTVNLDDMQGSFFVLFLGFAIAIVLISLEKLWFSYKANKDQKVIAPYIS